MGRLNGDGFGDLVLGAPGAGEDSAYVGYGSPSGSVTLQRIDASMYDDPSDYDYPDFGYSVAAAGDIDGDGYGDVVIGGDARSHGVGLAIIYFGGPTGIDVASGIPINPTPEAADFFGRAVMGIGDVNGDHLGDIAIGSQGTVSVYYGRADRDFAIPDLVLTGSGPGAFAAGLGFGSHLSSPADFNGDGFADLVVGEPAGWPPGVAPMPGIVGDGLVNVYWGSASGLQMVPNEVLVAPAGYDYFGFGLTGVGDVDSDGFDDLVAGALSGDGVSGAFCFFRGGPTGLPPVPTLVVTNPDPGQFGLSVSHLFTSSDLFFCAIGSSDGDKPG